MSMTSHWYIVHAYSNFEKKAAEEIKRQATIQGLADLIEVPSGLEGVIAFDTSIAEPDKEGSALRYRGVDIEDLVGRVAFEKVWGLLVDGSYEPGMPPAQPHPLAVRTGDIAEARRYYRRALELNPRDPGVRSHVAEPRGRIADAGG